VAVEVAAGVCQCANDDRLVTGRVTGRVRLNAGSVGSLGGGKTRRETPPRTGMEPLPKGPRVYQIQGQSTILYRRELEL
jgi:hypothetical protein